MTGDSSASLNRAASQSRDKRLSLTRGHPSGGHLTRADLRRAAIFGTIARLGMWLAASTMRLRTVNEPKMAGYRRLGPGPLLFALWHGDFFPIFKYASHSGTYIVVSRSPDGEILARVAEAAGFRTVRGSPTRGATRAMVDLVRVVRGGADAAIAVDGPKGPGLVVKAGIVLLAKKTGCPIVPLGAGLSRYKQFASWDRFRMPLPFARVLLYAGTPIRVPADASDQLLETHRVELQATLLELREKARELVGPAGFRRAEIPRGFASFASTSSPDDVTGSENDRAAGPAERGNP